MVTASHTHAFQASKEEGREEGASMCGRSGCSTQLAFMWQPPTQEDECEEEEGEQLDKRLHPCND